MVMSFIGNLKSGCTLVIPLCHAAHRLECPVFPELIEGQIYPLRAKRIRKARCGGGFASRIHAISMGGQAAWLFVLFPSVKSGSMARFCILCDRAFHCLHNALRRCSNALKGAAAQPCGRRKTQPGSARPAALIFRAANAIRESQN